MLKLFNNRWIISLYYVNVEIFVFLNKKINNKTLRNIILVVIFPLLLLRAIYLRILEFLISSPIIKYQNKNDLKKEYKYDMSIAIIVRNEAPYIKEWIEYHRLVGFEHIYLFDDRSEDNINVVLTDYISNGFVTYYKISETERQKMLVPQTYVYNAVIKKYKNESRYIAFIDADEFVICCTGSKLLDEIMKMQMKYRNFGGIGINWACYGSSGLKEKPTGLVIENYLYRADKDYWNCYHIKTIVNPRMVKDYVSPHFPKYKLGAYSYSPKGEKIKIWNNNNVDYSIIRINHYACKSYEEFINKINKGKCDGRPQYTLKEFEKNDKNDIYDDVMLGYVDLVKERLKNVQNCR